MQLREAVDLVYGIADSMPEGSEARSALRMVARACERGHRLTNSTLPAFTSVVQSVTMARAILSMALDGGGRLREAAQEAHDLLARALAEVEKKIDSDRPPREDDD